MVQMISYLSPSNVHICMTLTIMVSSMYNSNYFPYRLLLQYSCLTVHV